MGNILYTIGNTRIETVDLVAKAVSENFNKKFDEIIIFNTKESSEILSEQYNCYKKYLGDFIFTNINVDKYGNIDQQKLNNVFSKDGFKVIDLTNGQKTTASLIYMAASLCNIENIYYLLIKNLSSDKETTYEYIKMGKFEGIDNLSKINYFDLIYYNEEIDIIFKNIVNDKENLFSIIYNGLKTGISEFFKTDDYRSVVNNVTIGNESLIKYLKEYIITNQTCIEYGKENKVNLENKNTILLLKDFYNSYAYNGSNKDVLQLCTMPFLLESLKQYRNFSAHNSKNKYCFTYDETRTIINLSLEVLKCAKRNKEFWSILE